MDINEIGKIIGRSFKNITVHNINVNWFEKGKDINASQTKTVKNEENNNLKKVKSPKDIDSYKTVNYGFNKNGLIANGEVLVSSSSKLSEEDLEKIDSKNLLEYYKELIKNCKIDIFVSGNINNDTINLVKENKNINKLQERNIENKAENKKGGK